MTMVEATRIAKTTSKIKFSVHIQDPKDNLKSGDKIEGVLKLENTHKKKTQKVKSLHFLFWERVPLPEDDFDHATWTGDNMGDDLEGRDVGSSKKKIKEKLKSGEKTEIPFSIKIPGGLHTNRGGKDPSKDWFVGLSIGVKSKLIPSYQYNRIIPIENSDRSADWLD
jgi:hypothetical protein